MKILQGNTLLSPGYSSFKGSMLLLLLLTLVGCTDFFEPNEETVIARRDSILTQLNIARKEGRKSREKADFVNALAFQQKAIDLSLKTGDPIQIAQDYNQMGTTFRRMGRLEEALSMHYNGLQWAEKTEQDTSMQAQKNLNTSYNGLGNVHLTLGNDQEAEYFFRRALQGEKKISSGLGQAINYANLGSILQNRGELDSATVYYQQSLLLNEGIGSKLGVSLCRVYLGKIQEKLGELSVAEEEYKKAAILMEDDPDRWHAIEPLIALSQLLLSQKKTEEASTYIDQCVEIAADMHSFEHLQESAMLRSEYFHQIGNDALALEQIYLANNYRDSLINPEQERMIRDICINYEREKAQQEKVLIHQTYEAQRKVGFYQLLVTVGLLIAAIMTILVLVIIYRTRQKNYEALRSINSMRTTFFTNITHEFRTPLTVILGLADQLKSTGIAEEQRINYLQSIQKQGNTLLELVNQLLSMSKLMAGCGQGEWRHGDLLSFLRLTLSSYMDYAKSKGINLTISTHEDKIEMDFVPEYMDKVIRNLLSNSFKFTPAGGSISVNLEMKHGHLMIDVCDTGCGIAPDDLPHVFDLFYQGSVSRKQGSSGVGLPFVQQMIRYMGGIITIANQMPRGTRVHIVLPTSHYSEEPIREWKLTEEISQPWSSKKRKNLIEQTPTPMETEDQPVVLIVEDNEDVAEYEKLLLSNHYRVLISQDGYDALNKAEQQLPDIVITDLMMPGMDGYELCRTLRQSEMLSDVPIIIVSARSADQDRIKALEEGADAYLTKPFNNEELQLMVARLLERRREIRKKIRAELSQDSEQQAEGEETSTRFSQQDKEFIDQLNQIIHRQMGNGNMDVDTISQLMATSRSVLNRRIRAVTETSAAAYILQLRMERARHLIRQGSMNIGEVAMACGFEDMSYFTRVFRQNFGQTPSQFRQENNYTETI